ncbi:hypothetical protein C8R45DRAFT_1002444 [Mycena sanguinolenta]|nr:hypothetical protein C8R45DRAFT_1002444 [Mycena sanguinolenta]
MHVCCKSSLYGRPTASSSERLNHIIRKLRLRSQECTQFLTRATRSLWSICRLPPELLQEVFMFVVESATHARVSAPSTGRVPTTIDAIPLAHVCRYWRTLALDMSQLWATIQPPSIAAMSYLDFYLARVTPAPIPLTIICDCHQTSESVLDKMAHLSHRWRSLTLREYSDEIQSTLDHICDRIPLLECLRLSVVYELPILFTTSVFLDAPSLRHVDIALTSIYGLLRLTSFILPWRQLTFLTLKPILVSAFSEILRECPRLVYFNAEITYGGTHDGLPEIHTLTKLVLYGPRSEQAFCAHRFPQLLSLSIVINEPHIQPRLFESLVQSSHLEFLRMEARYAFQADDLITCCLHPPVELLLATPSLRIMVTRGRWRNSRLAMVTPRFDTPLVVRLPDDPFPPVAPWSLAEANAAKGRCNTFEATALLATVEARMKRDPSFDPYGIERTRLIDPEGKDELDYLDYL